MGRLTTMLFAMLLATASQADDDGVKSRFASALSVVSEDPVAAFAGMQILADEGYPRAMDRVAYFHLKGIGVPKDVSRAAEQYREAVRAGHSRSLLSLGKVELMRGEFEGARAVLVRAVDEGIANAEVTLAWAHATKRLGHLSHPETGAEKLLMLAERGNQDAEIALLAAAIAQPERRLVSDTLLTKLHDRAHQGDAKAAEGLLRYHRLSSRSGASVDARALLLRTPGLRARIAVEEGLYLASERQAPRFWSVSETLVRQAPLNVFPRALAVTAKINKNAYVRILHKELASLGYPVGPLSSYLNATQIRAIHQFCRDYGISAECSRGPLKSTAVKAIGEKIGQARHAILNEAS